MGLLKSLFKAKVRETREGIEDKHAVTLSEQELVDDQKAIDVARDELRNIKVEAKLDGDKLAEINAEIAQYEELGHQAQSEGNEENLLLIVEKITKLENDRRPVQESYDMNQDAVRSIEAQIRESEEELRHKKNEVASFRAKEASLKMQERSKAALDALGNSSSGSVMERAKARQQRKQAKMDLIKDEQNNKTDLDSRLAAAGLSGGPKSTSTSDVMARFKK